MNASVAKETCPVIDEFNWKRQAVASSKDEAGVIAGIDLATMLHDAALELVVEAFGVEDLESLSRLPARPILRSVSSTFQRPLDPGAPMFVGARPQVISERSFLLNTGLWLVDSARPATHSETREPASLVAYGTAGFVVIDNTSRKAVALPDYAANALHQLRGASTPGIAESRHQSNP